MATQRTVEYWFPHLATAVDNTATLFSQITVTLPAGAKTFRSVFAEIIAHDRNTTISNINRRQIELQLGAAGFSAVNNTNVLTQGGEQHVIQFSGDYTSYFTTNWTGTAMTCDLRVLMDSAAATPLNPSFNNFSARLVITLDVDETQATQVNTVWIPLNAPAGALATAKPGAANATIPALDTWLEESGKTILQTTVVVQGNTEGGGTTDKSLSFEIGTLGVFTSQLYEHGSSTDMWYRLNQVVSFPTNAAQSFYIWASAADFDHPQVWLCVTYSWDASASARMTISTLLPAEIAGGFGGNTSATPQRVERQLWIQEPGVITTKAVAALIFWDQAAPIAGLNMRLGSGAYTAYTSVATALSGGCGAMIRNDAAFTLARGRNMLYAEMYRTDTVDVGANASTLFMVTYSCDVPAQGWQRANRTVIRNLRVTGTVAAGGESIVAAVGFNIPSPNYFLNAIGVRYCYTSNSTSNPMGCHIGTERLSGEGGVFWENVYEAMGATDPEVGIHECFATARSVFSRWAVGATKEADSSRLDIEVARRWRAVIGGGGTSFDHIDLYITYHAIEYTVGGNITGSNGGAVNLTLHRADTHEAVLNGSRIGNGAYSFTWFDNTENVYVSAREGAAHLGRSDNGLATGAP